MRIVFLGTGDIGVPSLQALAARHDVAAVYTQPDRPAGRDLKLRPSPVKAAALALGLPVFQPEKIRKPEAVAELAAWGAEVIVVVAYGQILPRSILEMPRLGCLNVHASLLPRHRGASPIHAAILAGDAESGVTIMQMDEGLDTGPMLRAVRTPLGPEETAGSLHDRLGQLAPAALLEVLDGLAAGTLAAEKQDDALATHAPKLARQDGCIDWAEPAEEIDRRVRGLTPWPGAFTFLPDGRMLKIHRASPLSEPGGPPGEVLAASGEGICVAAGGGAMLLREVQAAGGRRQSAADFLRGNPVPSGTRLAASSPK
jgi:methionyl-tRNA formyltransferase